MAMTEEQIQAKIDALTAKKKELQKKEREKKKKQLAKEKAEREKAIAMADKKIAGLARLLMNNADDELIIQQYVKMILQKYPERKEKVEELMK